MKVKINYHTVRFVPETFSEKAVLHYLAANNATVLGEYGAATKEFKALRIEPAPKKHVVAAPQAGAAGSNPAQLSDNGATHQIAVLPLAGSPSDNTSQRETARPCFGCISEKYPNSIRCNACSEGSEYKPA